MKAKTYDSYTKNGAMFIANRVQENRIKNLKPGIYVPYFDPQHAMTWFEEKEVISDGILELPSKEYTQITQEMRDFMKPETKALFEKYGFVYKRSALLHGEPGVGKTITVTRIIRDVIDKGGLVLFVDNPNVLRHSYDVLNDVAPDQFTLVVFEEFDRMVAQFESDLLSILDGEIQKNNVMYLATTNYIDRIPARLRRPGRFSSTIEVKYPSLEARQAYFNYKTKDSALSLTLAEQTDGLSVDELKEVVQAHIILNQGLADVVAKLKDNRQLPIQTDPEYDEEAEAAAEMREMMIQNMGTLYEQTPVPRIPKRRNR